MHVLFVCPTISTKIQAKAGIATLSQKIPNRYTREIYPAKSTKIQNKTPKYKAKHQNRNKNRHWNALIDDPTIVLGARMANGGDPFGYQRRTNNRPKCKQNMALKHSRR
eukprot:GEMP01042599.1.p4 GENE.GEMP01042599.1~~GEMP01042599.1.p4  ORF type:complete len:109 (+),score=2.78 GEMP01042599.1:1436-1762(+)